MIGLGLAALALVYVRGWSRLRTKSPAAIPAWRAGVFLVGLVLIWIAAGSRVACCDEGSLTMHMVQHLLLLTMAPLLILLGEPVMVLGARTRLGHDRTLGLALCWFPATAALVGWHLPAAFTLALRSHAWHAVEQATFLATGLLFWWPVVQPWPSRPNPRWSIVLYLFLATLPCDILSGFLMFSDRIAYPVYLVARSAQTVLDDQQCAAALMWTCVTIVYLVAGTVVSTQLLAPVPGRILQRVEVD